LKGLSPSKSTLPLSFQGEGDTGGEVIREPLMKAKEF